MDPKEYEVVPDPKRPTETHHAIAGDLPFHPDHRAREWRYWGIVKAGKRRRHECAPRSKRGCDCPIKGMCYRKSGSKRQIVKILEK